MATAAQRQKKYRNRILSEGLCAHCKKSRDREGAYCTTCCHIHVAYNRRLKEDVITHYGGKCKCCGETVLVFLCIDHVDGKGAEHRRSIYPQRPWGGRSNGASGVKMYGWLKAHEYPEGFQVLCFNCNSAKHILGVCPHQLEKDSACHKNL